MIDLDNYFLQITDLVAGEKYSVGEIIKKVDPNIGGWIQETKAKLL